MATDFSWFTERMSEQSDGVDVTNIWDSRRHLQELAFDLLETLHNGTTEEIIDECAKISVLSMKIADKARFGTF